jgi:hypothetical protein
MKNFKLIALGALIVAALFWIHTPGVAARALIQPAALPADARNDALRGMNDMASSLNDLDQRHMKIIELNGRMSDLFSSLRQKVADATRAAANDKGMSPQTRQAFQQLQESQTSLNLQYLQLQAQMQNENRQYTAVSNIMKTKHDTVKNSISNIR